jgi:hypothetical protein
MMKGAAAAARKYNNPDLLATSILSGIEVMHVVKKGQLHRQVKSAQNEVEFIHKLFGISS